METDDHEPRMQRFLGWGTLIIVLTLALAMGGNRPLAWITFSILILPIFIFQIIVLCRYPTPVALRRAWPIAGGLLALLAWTLTQIVPGLPLDWAHPVWVLAPEEAVPSISADPIQGAHGMLRITTYGMIGWIIVTTSIRRERAWSFVETIGLVGAAYALYGIVAGLSGINPILGSDGSPQAVSATFANRNAFAIFAALGLLANVTMLQHRLGGDDPIPLKIERFFALAWPSAFGSLLCAAAIAMSNSRAGGAVALIGLGLLLVLLEPGRRRFAWLILAALVGFVLLTLTDETLQRIASARVNHHRLLVYEEILAQIQTRPWLGHGLGAFHDTFRAHLPFEVAQAEWRMAHNSYLENVYELGVPAACLLYGLLLGIMARLIRAVRHRRHDCALPAFALASMVTCALHAGIDFSMQMPALAALLVVIMSIGWAQSFGRKDRRFPMPAL